MRPEYTRKSKLRFLECRTPDSITECGLKPESLVASYRGDRNAQKQETRKDEDKNVLESRFPVLDSRFSVPDTCARSQTLPGSTIHVGLFGDAAEVL